MTEARARALQALMASRAQLREALAPPDEDPASTQHQGVHSGLRHMMDLALHLLPQGPWLPWASKLMDAALHASPLTASGIQVGRLGVQRLQDGARRHPWLWAGIGLGAGALLMSKRRWIWRLATAFALPRLLRTGQALGHQLMAEMGQHVLTALHQGAAPEQPAGARPSARAPD